ncbi:hypothetical protein BD414DRAFT_581885 [Trametes punicea]|nr:hypothetical protein BD414DRAFT_581885 [Trametes punicea]
MQCDPSLEPVNDASRTRDESHPLLPIGIEPDMNNSSPEAASSSAHNTRGSNFNSHNAVPSPQPGAVDQGRTRHHRTRKPQEQGRSPQVPQRIDESKDKKRDASLTRPVAKHSQGSRQDPGKHESRSGTANSRPSLRPTSQSGRPEPVTVRCTTTPIDAPYAMLSSNSKASKAGSSASAISAKTPGTSSASASSSRPVARKCSEFSDRKPDVKTSASRRDGPEYTAVKSTITPIVRQGSSNPPVAASSLTSARQPVLPDSLAAPSSSHNKTWTPTNIAATSKPAGTSAIGASTDPRSNGQAAKSSALPSSTPPSGLASKQALSERAKKERDAHERLLKTIADITERARNRPWFTCEDASRYAAERARLKAAGEAKADAGPSTVAFQASHAKVRSKEGMDNEAQVSKAKETASKSSAAAGAQATPAPSSSSVSQSKAPALAEANKKGVVPSEPRAAYSSPRQVSARTGKVREAIAQPTTVAGTKASPDPSKPAHACATDPAAASSIKAKASASAAAQTEAIAKPVSRLKAVATQTDPELCRPGSSRETRDVSLSTSPPFSSPHRSKAQDLGVLKTATPNSGHLAASAVSKAEPDMAKASADPRKVIKARETKSQRVVETPKQVSAFLARSLQPQAPALPGPEQPAAANGNAAGPVPTNSSWRQADRRDLSSGDGPSHNWAGNSMSPSAPQVVIPKQEGRPSRPRAAKDVPPASVPRNVGSGTQAVLSTKSYSGPRELSHQPVGGNVLVERPSGTRSKEDKLAKQSAPTPTSSSVASTHSAYSFSTKDSSLSRLAYKTSSSVPTADYNIPSPAVIGPTSSELDTSVQSLTVGSQNGRDRKRNITSSWTARRPSTADACGMPSAFTLSVYSEAGKSALSTGSRPSTSEAACAPSSMSMREVTRRQARISKADTVVSAVASIVDDRPSLPTAFQDIASREPVISTSRAYPHKSSAPSSAVSPEAGIVKTALVISGSAPSEVEPGPTTLVIVSSPRGPVSADPKKSSEPATKPLTDTREIACDKPLPRVPSRASSAISPKSVAKLEEHIARMESLALARTPLKSSMKTQADLVSCTLGDEYAVVKVEDVVDIDENGAGPSRLRNGKAVRFEVTFPNQSDSTLSTLPTTGDTDGEASSSLPRRPRTNRAEVLADSPPRYSSLSPLKGGFSGSSTSLPPRTHRGRTQSDVTGELRHAQSVPFLCRSSSKLQEFKKGLKTPREPFYAGLLGSRSMTHLPAVSTRQEVGDAHSGRSKARRLWNKAKNGLGLGKREEPPVLQNIDMREVWKSVPPRPRPLPSWWPPEKQIYIR